MTSRAPGMRARVHLRRDRLVAIPDDEAGDVPSDHGGPMLVERRGKLVRTRPSASASAPSADDVETIGALPASWVIKPTGKIELTLITVFALGLLLPVSWALGPLRMTPFLLFLSASFAPLVFMWLAQSRTSIMFPDICMLIFCAWASIALGVNSGWQGVTEPIGVLWLTTFGAYLAGRLLVRDPRSLRWLVRLMTITFMFLIPLLIIEMITDKKPLLQLASLIGKSAPPLDIGRRFGLQRAQGPFEHPIAMGVFTASLFAPAVYIFGGDSKIKRTLGGVASAFACMCSVSTGALLSLNVQIGLMLWSRLLRTVKKRWRILTAILVAMYFGIDMVSERTPFHVFVNYATFSQGSSYNRILIWEFGSAEALRHPFFGIGMNDWTRPKWMSDSMDNFWLVQAVRYGIPSFLLLAAAIMTILWRMGNIPERYKDLIPLRRAMTFSIMGTAITVGSVHLWNAGYVWYMFIIGATAWLSQSHGKTAE